jgi:hypothetical protein
MQMPNVVSKIIDQEKKITFEIIAYRPLSREEMVLSVRQFLAQKKKPKLQPGSTIKIISIIGCND